jgi:AcrR family transcriptional regulator
MDDKKQAILDAAIALADEKGLSAVSMRAVAERAGLTAMALYPYVGTKAALLDEMAGRLVSQILLPEAPDGAGPDWRTRLHAVAWSSRRLFRQHPWAPTLLDSLPYVTPDATRTVDAIYTALLDAGVPEPEVPRIERLLSTLFLGYAASEAEGRFGQKLDQRARRARREQLLGHALPGHRRLARWLEVPVDWDADFEAGLQDILRFIEAVAARSPA